MGNETFVYVTFIEASPERVFEALTNGEFTRIYWAGRRIESTWAEGSPVHLYLEDTHDFEVSGTVLAYDPPRRLAYSWMLPHVRDASPSIVSFELQRMGESVKLSVTHEPLPEGDMARQGWSAIMSSLKSFIETGRALSATEMWRRRSTQAESVEA